MDYKNQLEELEQIIRSLSKSCTEARMRVSLLKIASFERLELDDLTHLLRRNSFMSQLKDTLKNAQYSNKIVHLMLMDVDHFKQVNDRFGHPCGDQVLEKISALIKGFLRPQDLAGRYGGEEIIVAVECNSSAALDIAERIRKATAEIKFVSPLGGTDTFQVTLSVGIASSQQQGYSLEKLIAAADAQLYLAKNQGRNRIAYDLAA